MKIFVKSSKLKYFSKSLGEFMNFSPTIKRINNAETVVGFLETNNKQLAEELKTNELFLFIEDKEEIEQEEVDQIIEDEEEIEQEEVEQIIKKKKTNKK